MNSTTKYVIGQLREDYQKGLNSVEKYVRRRDEITVALALVNFLILRFLEPLKGKVT